MFKRVIRLIVSLIIHIIEKPFLYFLPGRCIIICYHDIPIQHKELFSKQLTQLEKKTIPIRIDFDKKLKRGHLYSIVTFDDAFSTVAYNALPYLKKHQIPATIFVPTSFVGKYPSYISTSNINKKNDKILSENELRIIDKDKLLTIGSHGKTHKRFTEMSSEESENEFQQSKMYLENLLGHQINYFCFPHGSFSSIHVEQAKITGYKKIFSILPSTNQNFNSEFCCGRITAEPNDWPIEFYLKMYGAYSWTTFITICKLKANDFSIFNKLKKY